MAEEMAMSAGFGGIDLAYERMGRRAAPAVVLVMGVAAQMIHWPDAFCAVLVEGGLQVVRFDNRDAGRSTHITQAPAADLPAALRGDFSSASYTLREMAGDVVGLMNALGLERAHVVGASMGGAVAQTLAMEYPERVKSLTSMMSTTGAPGVGQVAPDVMREVFSGPPAVTRAEVVERMVRAARAVGSPGYPGDGDEIAARAALAYDRGYDPAGTARQAVATVASGDRTEGLKRLRVPALVIHGLADRMCDVSGGRATAEAIPGAELLLVEGMGHDLAPGLRGMLAERIAEFVWKVEGR